MIRTDDILSPEEIERFTGIERDRYIAQRNFLKDEGIKCIVNARKEVIVTWSWIQQAGTAKARQPLHIEEAGMPDFSSMSRKRA